MIWDNACTLTSTSKQNVSNSVRKSASAISVQISLLLLTLHFNLCFLIYKKAYLDIEKVSKYCKDKLVDISEVKLTVWQSAVLFGKGNGINQDKQVRKCKACL